MIVLISLLQRGAELRNLTVSGTPSVSAAIAVTKTKTNIGILTEIETVPGLGVRIMVDTMACVMDKTAAVMKKSHAIENWRAWETL
jgi:hypothetical protein